MSLNPSAPYGQSKTHNQPGISGCAISAPRLPTNYYRLIAEVSARMVKASNEDLDDEILRALRETLETLGVDRLSISACASSALFLTAPDAGKSAARSSAIATVIPWQPHE